jgi:hypothetical protein
LRAGVIEPYATSHEGAAGSTAGAGSTGGSAVSEYPPSAIFSRKYSAFATKVSASRASSAAASSDPANASASCTRWKCVSASR